MRAFEIDISVRSYELDMLGHVNNAVYLSWLEQARLSALEACGFTVRGLVDGSWLTNIVRAEIDFRKPVLYGDRLHVSTRLERVGRTSLTLGHEIRRGVGEADGGEVVSTATVVIVWLDAEGRPTPVPARAVRGLRGEGPVEGATDSDEETT